MKSRMLVLSLMLALTASAILSGCTTEQRGGRTTGQYIDDKALNTKVKAALSDDAEYKFPDVKVESYRGSVQLSGFVASAAQKARATQIAKSVKGVQSVDNKVSVQNP